MVLIGGEIVEMLGMYVKGDFDFVGFVVGVMECGKLLFVGVKDGDVLLGFVLDGVYFNGFLLVCKVVEYVGLIWELFNFFGSGMLGQVLLVFMWFYVNVVLVVIYLGGVYVVVYIIGGGIIENLLCVLFKGLGVEIDLNSFMLFVVFDWLVEVGGIVDVEMLKIFNLGVGMIFVVVVDCVEVLEVLLKFEGEIVFCFGYVMLGEGVCYFGNLW